MFAKCNGGEKFFQLVEKASFDAENEQKNGGGGACKLKTPFLGQTLAKFGECVFEVLMRCFLGSMKQYSSEKRKASNSAVSSRKKRIVFSGFMHV